MVFYWDCNNPNFTSKNDITMKKNISINISGMIFYIEEDCYPTLKAYLAAIHQYFANYEDGREIIEDIEVRIAEIFCETLRKDKQVITQDDVTLLMQTMGSISDFQEAEENPAFHITFEEEEEDNHAKPNFEIPTEHDFFEGGNTAVQVQPKNPQRKREHAFISEEKPKKPHHDFEPVMLNHADTKQEEEEKERTAKRLYRDNQRKIVGGVAAGVAHYLNIDAIWVRIMWVLCLSGFFWYSEIPSIAFVLYIALWMVVPESDELEENPQLKKLFRDSERNVIAGVSSGLASYLGISELLVRVLFIFTTFMFGTGIFIYLILWIIIPEAKTLTEKMQMRGQPINLSSIRENIQANLESIKGEDLGRIHKAILVPFHLFAFLMNRTTDFLRPFVGFTADFIRIVGGILLVVISLLTTVVLITLTLVLLGWGFENYYQFDRSPLHILEECFGNASHWHVLNAFFALFIPVFFIGLFGVMMLTRRIIWNHRFGWSIAGFWLISMIGFGISASAVASNFNVESSIGHGGELAPVEGVLELDLLKQKTTNGIYAQQHLKISSNEGKSIMFNRVVKAKGKNHADAEKNAKMLQAVYRQVNNQIIFGKYAEFTKNAVFRNQQIYLELSIPKGQVFKISPALAPLLYQTYTALDTKLSKEEAGRLWKFNEEGNLVPHFETAALEEDAKIKNEVTEKLLTLESFNEIEASGNIYLVVEPYANQYALGGDYDKVEISQKNNKLSLASKKGLGFSKNLKIIVYTKALNSISLSGACFAQMGLKKQDKLAVELTGASKLSVASRGQIIKRLRADVSGSSELQATETTFQEVKISLSGASRADLNVIDKLNVEASGASTLRYLSKPKYLETDISGASQIKALPR